MYLRFTVPGTVTRARVAPGPFSEAHRLSYRYRDEPAGIALRRELDWFNAWLPVPRRFVVHSKGHEWWDGICWFRDDAREMVGHAYVLAALLKECGVPVERIWTRHPGQVLYRDRFQVVAKPERKMLRIQPGPPLAGRAHSPQEVPMPKQYDTQPSFRADQQAA